MKRPSRLVRCVVLLLAIAFLVLAIILPILTTAFVIVGCSLLFIGMAVCLLPASSQEMAASDIDD